MKHKKIYLWLCALVALTPLGLLAGGSAWGEWTSDEVKKQVGFIPKGMKSLENIWSGLMSGYNLQGFLPAGRHGNSFFLQAIGYVFSAAVGVALIFLAFKLIALVIPNEPENTRGNQ